MPDFSLIGGSEGISIGFDSATSSGTSVTSSATADTKGAWVELEASTSEEVSGIVIRIVNITAAPSGSEFLFDIGVGSVGNEEPIVNNINIVCGNLALNTGRSIDFPICIPKGSRVSVRAQSSAGAQSFSIIIVGSVPSFTSNQCYSEVVTIGADLANTLGTTFDPGTTVNTKGAWSEIEASTSSLFAGFGLSISSNQNAGQTDQTGLLDIGIGSAGNEEVILADVPYRSTTQEFSTIASGYYPITIPEGSRVSVRAQCSTTNIDRIHGIYINGVK